MPTLLLALSIDNVRLPRHARRIDAAIVHERSLSVSGFGHKDENVVHNPNRRNETGRFT